MKILIILSLITFSFVTAINIRGQELTAQNSFKRSLLMLQDKIYAIDYNIKIECKNNIFNDNQQLSQETIDQSLKICDVLLSITENKEQRNIDQGRMKVCIQNQFQNKQTKEQVALYQYVDCLVNDTVKKYSIDRIKNLAETSNNDNSQKGYWQIQDLCSNQLFSFDNKNVIQFFDQLDQNCLLQKKEVYVRMRVLEEASKQFDELLTCIDQIQSKNCQGKKLIRDYIVCQQQNYIPNQNGL
ncbi:hypothetical protein TTHERM_00916420 (macronuclear) [Tetrahymena thermophila SB210]|uniref:Transmembrane protein n=1 Tax=Tetrahymena thermophila (strain SB210) TaxID=312017 RepID=Q23TS9_TETTS|nr:hypothetical protein TTHERM_00916420 [Tetrahymena thermophila SB210]EAR99966.2 hypothetical protein TTHERM_00916420 [Tetrahymena thermophila SB210]|eukprot:XP_001020211.2 hypothetical protein TTHERM_00916420 [Tetrahymena thermophila SB210]